MREVTTNSATNQKPNGNATLYFFQGIACILVVLIHIPFPDLILVPVKMAYIHLTAR